MAGQMPETDTFARRPETRRDELKWPYCELCRGTGRPRPLAK